jgi:hypothetical protein
MVDTNGANDYPDNAIWLTDGYGDYVRHYLRAMAADPSLAPYNQDHLLGTSSLVQSIAYQPGDITYTTADIGAQDVLRVSFVPNQVTEGGVALNKLDSIADLQTQDGYTLDAPGDAQGVLRIHHSLSATVSIADTSTELAAPVNLSAKATSSSAITLTWTGNSNHDTQYFVDRSTDSSFTYNVVTSESSNTSFVDTDGLDPWTTYYYRVRTVTAKGTSLNALTTSVQTPAGNLPSGFVDEDEAAGAPGGPAQVRGDAEYRQCPK